MDTLIDNTALTNKVLENLKDGASNASGSTSRPLLAIRERVASLAISMGVLGVSLAVILVATSFLMAATGTIQPSVIMVATMKVGGVAVATLILTGAVGLALGSEVKRSAQKLPD